VEPKDLAMVSGVLSSLLSDFSIRSAPKSAILGSAVGRIALPRPDGPLSHLLANRALRLNCLTVHYADLWNACWDERWAMDSSPLPQAVKAPITPRWSEASPLRRALDRRNALVEIDALVALLLGVPIDDLCTIYRTQFAVLHG